MTHLVTATTDLNEQVAEALWEVDVGLLVKATTQVKEMLLNRVRQTEVSEVDWPWKLARYRREEARQAGRGELN